MDCEAGRFDNIHGDEDFIDETPDYCDDDEYLWSDEEC